ncbi:hypothetical protein [Agromyces protaetiae]
MHHYDRIDREALWVTVRRSFSELAHALDDVQAPRT